MNERREEERGKKEEGRKRERVRESGEERILEGNWTEYSSLLSSGGQVNKCRPATATAAATCSDCQ